VNAQRDAGLYGQDTAERAFAYERIEIVSEGTPSAVPPASLFGLNTAPGIERPLAIPGNTGTPSAGRDDAGLPLGVPWNPAPAGGSGSVGASGSADGLGVVLIGADGPVHFGAGAASELPQGESGFLMSDGTLEIPNWQVVFVPEVDESAEAAVGGDFNPEVELEIPQGSRDFDLTGELELPGDPNERIGEPDLLSVNTVSAHCDACDDDRWQREKQAAMPVCESAGWRTVEVQGNLMPGGSRRLVDAQLAKAQAVYGQCCVEVDMVDLDVWGDDRAADLLGNNLYLDEENILQDQLGFFTLSREQLDLLELGAVAGSGEPVPVWWTRRTRDSEVGYIMRANTMAERTVILSGGLEADYEANNIVLAHELGHVLLEGQLDGDHHDYMHPRNLMASGRINTGGGELTSSQCGWIRASPYLR